MTALQYYAGRQGGRAQHAGQQIRKTSGRRTQDGRRTDVGRTSDGSRTKVGRKFDERRTNKAQPPLLPWQVAALHYNSWQRNAAVRLAEHYNSLLWRGRQSVAARCCGEAGRALQLIAVARPATGYSSLLRQWPAALQLAAMADSTLQRFCVLFLFYFIVLLDNFKSKRERDRKRKGGRAFETCSKISTLLVGRNVTHKLPPVLTQAPSGSSNTNTLRLRQQ